MGGTFCGRDSLGIPLYPCVCNTTHVPWGLRWPLVGPALLDGGGHRPRPAFPLIIGTRADGHRRFRRYNTDPRALA